MRYLQMKAKVKMIKKNGKPVSAVVPIKLWNGMIEEIEDLQDALEAREISERLKSGAEESFPFEFVIDLIEK